MKLLVKKIRCNAVIPQRATKGSAGYDLTACIEEPVLIKHGDIVKVPTGIAVALSSSEAAVMIFARSGLASKHGITLANSVGVVDSDYRGEIFIPLLNHGKDYEIQPMERIAQMIIMPVEAAQMTVCETLPESERGEGGFGSTGK